MSDTPSSWSTSPSLIEQVQASDAQAWERLSYIYTPMVYNWVRRSGMQEADSADIVQEVFSRVLESIDRFEHQSFRGWLLTITRNEIRGWHRRRQSRMPDAVGGSAAMSQIENAPDPLLPDDDSIDPTETQGVVRRAAEMIKDDFEPKTWQAFWRSVVEGQSSPEIAEALDMTPNAIRQAKFRVICRLRETLGDDLV